MERYEIYNAADLLRSPELLPETAGVYFIVLNTEGALDQALSSQAASLEKAWWARRRVLYIGSTKRGLRRRLFDHLDGDCRGSSFRFSLGLLLQGELRLEVTRGQDKVGLTFGALGERRLSRWISTHTSVAVRSCADPEAIERVLIRHTQPLLNLEHQARTAWTVELFRNRRAVRRSANAEKGAATPSMRRLSD